MENTNNQAISKSKKIAVSLGHYTALAVVLLLILFSVSIFEFFSSGILGSTPQAPLRVLLFTWLNDLTFWLNCSLYCAPAYLLLYFLNPRIARVLFITIFSFLAVNHLLLVAYFATAKIPLGADLFGYSAADVIQTLGASGAVSTLSIVGMILAIVLITFTLIALPKKIKVGTAMALSLPMAGLIGLLSEFTNTSYQADANSDYTNNLALNKSELFYSDAVGHFTKEAHETDIYAEGYLGVYSNIGAAGLVSGNVKFIEEQNYPFLHSDSMADVLSPFFIKSADKPNIVILVVEGLGRAFSNEGASLGNFTPFLDSLAGKSLYFSNFLSAGGRTFAVLPSLLASLPYAENGFLELGTKMPRHVSLINTLKNSGYHTSFYYGGDSRFDNMDLFLKRNELDQLNDAKTFPAGYHKLPALNGFSWGYGDKELYRRYFETQTGKPEKPQLSIFLTISSHSPFLLNEQDKYLNRFDNRLVELGIAKEDRSKYQQYKSQYASILYADDALKSFFASYSTRPDYKKTIFIITGDHRMPEIPMETKIDRYHVPLVIYSPLLKRTAKIESISSHLDVTPSLLAFLKKEYSISTPALCSWTGTGLDTVRAFRNIHRIPLIQTKTRMSDYLAGNFHFSGGSLYKLFASMGEEMVDNKEVLIGISDAFGDYKRRNQQFLNGKKLLPDSITRKFYNSIGKIKKH